WNDLPMPYTADRFYLENGDLKVVHAPYESFEDFVRTYRNPQAWSRAVDFFANNDPFYRPLSFRSTPLDRSSLVRLVRRAYNQRERRRMFHASIDKSGFNAESEQVQIAREIVHRFSLRARQGGMIPIIFLVN